MNKFNLTHVHFKLGTGFSTLNDHAFPVLPYIRGFFFPEVCHKLILYLFLFASACTYPSCFEVTNQYDCLLMTIPGSSLHYSQAHSPKDEDPLLINVFTKTMLKETGQHTFSMLHTASSLKL